VDFFDYFSDFSDATTDAVTDFLDY